MVTEPLGLRDRKREETRRRLESAAVTLVLRDGLEHATVDSISSTADVSSRTFFNYFDSKEDAILGIHDIELTPGVVTEHIMRNDGVDAVESTVILLLSLISPSIEGKALHQQRHEVLKRHPQLFGRHVAQMTRMIDTLTDAVSAILEHDATGLGSNRAEAEVLLSLCGGAVRSSVKEWVALDPAEPVERIQPERPVSSARFSRASLSRSPERSARVTRVSSVLPTGRARPYRAHCRDARPSTSRIRPVRSSAIPDPACRALGGVGAGARGRRGASAHDGTVVAAAHRSRGRAGREPHADPVAAAHRRPAPEHRIRRTSPPGQRAHPPSAGTRLSGSPVDPRVSS
ncbi:hypothetical protein AX769_20015 [Frondihabitans sp. PAMC 28766]|uniref:TetR/AcrR family transcriptional regulator n=1 Tax=Frondihabitans sp. PAMC 28766 TaxID=1795630 RepID=UPI00078C73AC|nr:TetR/AcrR family transcriptional regulator [Frondihabitans sp. PAMC 28766]AMM22014.1 hypothetical protein AX769_20015 [Frondihabitans sp. PAMC 28766]